MYFNENEREKLVNRLYELSGKPLSDGSEMKDIIFKLTDDKLFKYRFGTLNDVLNLSNNQLPFSSANTLNDPFECEYRFKELEDIYYNNEYYWESMNKHTQKFKKETHICSFSEKNNNILMWAHYANNHKGFCLEYSLSELLLHAFQIIMPVIYAKDMPLVDEKDSKNTLKIIYTKAEQWKYELEWRISQIIGSNENFMLLSVPKPKALYLGCKIENGLKEYLIDICQKNAIDVYQGEKDNKEFKLNFNKIN